MLNTTLRKVVCLCAIATIGLVGFGCSGAKVLTNPTAKFPLAIDEKSPAFLFPINMSHLGSIADPNLMGASVTAGVIGKYGAKLISGQQLFDLVGNLSFELAETIESQVNANKWEMTGSAEGTATTLANMMENIMKTLASLKLIQPGYSFQYIICLHSHGSKGMIPMKLDVDTWGGIYDVKTKQILCYMDSKSSMMDDDKGVAILGQLPKVYNDLLGALISGGAKK